MPGSELGAATAGDVAESAAASPAFTPLPLPVLLRRIAHEWRTRHTIFDLPPGRFFDASAGPDLSVRFLGRPAATPARPGRRTAHPARPEHRARLAGGGPDRRAQDRPGARPARDPAAVHRHGDGRLQRRVEPGAPPRAVARGVRQGLRCSSRSSAAGTSSARTSAPTPVPTSSTCRSATTSPASRRPRVAAFIDGLVDARATIDRLRPGIPEPFARLARSPVPGRRRRLGHALDVPRLSAGRDRRHRPPPDDPPRPRRRRQAEPDAPRPRARLGHPARTPRLRGAAAAARGLRGRPVVRAGGGAHPGARCVRARARATLRDQAHQHARGRQPPRRAARRPDVPVRAAAPRPRGDAPRRAAPRAARDPCRRRGGRPGRGELLGRDHPGTTWPTWRAWAWRRSRSAPTSCVPAATGGSDPWWPRSASGWRQRAARTSPAWRAHRHEEAVARRCGGCRRRLRREPRDRGRGACPTRGPRRCAPPARRPGAGALGLHRVQRVRDRLPQRRLPPRGSRLRGGSRLGRTSTSTSPSSATAAATARCSVPRTATRPRSSPRCSSTRSGSRPTTGPGSCWCATATGSLVVPAPGLEADAGRLGRILDAPRRAAARPTGSRPRARLRPAGSADTAGTRPAKAAGGVEGMLRAWAAHRTMVSRGSTPARGPRDRPTDAACTPFARRSGDHRRPRGGRLRRGRPTVAISDCRPDGGSGRRTGRDLCGAVGGVHLDLLGQQRRSDPGGADSLAGFSGARDRADRCGAPDRSGTARAHRADGVERR